MKKFFAIVLAGFTLLAAICSFNMNARERANSARISRNVRIFTSALQNLNEMYVDTLDVDDLTRQAIDYMLYQIDPYTSYFSEEDMDEYTSIASGHYGGIGCVISKIGDSIVAYQPHLGKPAHNFGLRHGDRFVEIDGHAITSATTTSDASKAGAITDLFSQAGLDFTVAELVKSINQPLQEINPASYDAIVMYNHADVTSLLESYPDFKQGETKIISYGKGVVSAIEKAGLEIAIQAPTPEITSAARAIEVLLSGK